MSLGIPLLQCDLLAESMLIKSLKLLLLCVKCVRDCEVTVARSLRSGTKGKSIALYGRLLSMKRVRSRGFTVTSQHIPNM